MKQEKDTLNISHRFVEVVDENGKSIKGINGIQIYEKSLLVFTDGALYSNKPDILKMKYKK